MIGDIIGILHQYGLLLLVGAWPNGPIGGLILTLILAAVGLIVSFPLSIAMGVGQLSPFRPVALSCRTYVTLVRAIPLLLLIFWAYFMVPLMIGRTVSGVTTVICALIIYEISYLSEVVRSAIQALPKGQFEAGRSLGLGYFRTLSDIILPQALYNAIPSILNQFISLLKNTSLAYIISVEELTYEAYQINAQLLTKPVEVYIILASTYFILCFSLSRAVRLVEVRIDRRRRSNLNTGLAS